VYIGREFKDHMKVASVDFRADHMIMMAAVQEYRGALVCLQGAPRRPRDRSGTRAGLKTVLAAMPELRADRESVLRSSAPTT
jgi:hypothetical protein